MQIDNLDNNAVLSQITTQENNLIKNEDIISIFDLLVQRSPDNIALSYYSQNISYLELSKKSHILADKFSELGIESGDIIAISLNRGPEMIIAMLAALRCEAAFLPIDPNYPEERRSFMLSDSNPKLLVTTSNLKGSIANEMKSEQVVNIDQLLGNNDSPNINYLNSLAIRSNLRSPAYIIYTSGSTGKPKGAINTKLGLVNLAKQQIETFNITYSSRILQFASFSFDASISEIVMALCSGATLVLAEQKDLMPGPSLVKLIVDNRITHVTLPPSVLAVIPENAFSDLKVVIVAGEACPLELAKRWARHTKFFNAYGVSEAAVCSTIYQYDPAISALPIGKAMPGIKTIALDDKLQRVKVGEIGELYIGGLGVGLGYLNRAELTLQKFVELNIDNCGIERFYRSGDRVKLLLDGSLEYIGREDNQIKIRGFRIELDEIVHSIESFKGVLQSAVVVNNQLAEHGQLVAYVKIDNNLNSQSSPINAGEISCEFINQLRSFLKDKLPAHMIPTHIIEVENFPLSPSGKIDLKILSKLEIKNSNESSPKKTYNLNETEKKLSDLCKEILKLKSFSLENSFFELGGDSLQAAQLTWMIEEEFSIKIGESEILGAANLFALSELIQKKEVISSLPLIALTHQTPIDATPSQEIFAVLERLNVDTSSLNCCAAFEIHGDIDHEILQDAYIHLFTRHQGLRLRFIVSENDFKLTTHNEIQPNIELIDLKSSPEQSRQLDTFFKMAERIRFDIQNDLLVRCFLLRLNSNHYIFVLIAHHAIFDAWSLNVFTQDLFYTMNAILTKGPSLIDLKVQYLDYVVWLKNNLKLRDEKKIRGYLDKVFAKPLKQFDLNEIKPRPSIKSGIGENVFTAFSKEETGKLHHYCEKRLLSPFMLCSALLKAALFYNSGQSDITIGGPVSIRYHRELERQIGLYGSAYITRTIFNENESFESYFERMRRSLLESYSNQIYSIKDILEEYNFEVDLSRTAPYDVSVASHMFDMPICQKEVLTALNIDIKPYRFPLSTSFFDFEFTFHLFNGEIELETRFDAALYTREQIERLARNFRELAIFILHSSDLSLKQGAKLLS